MDQIKEEVEASRKTNLFTLPRELRDIIMGHVLLKPTNTITMLANFGCHANEISASQPAISTVNRQLRAEALPAFYSGNTFTAQLDNNQDLQTAKDWLKAIGNANVRHIRHLALCGWTRVPFGHMVSRRWIRVVLNLKEGKVDLGCKDGDFLAPGDSKSHAENYEDVVRSTVGELEQAFQRAVKARKGDSFDVQSVADILDGFNMVCTGY